jgi:poly-gamma-glutamate synthesis protein (capsule biosynthesis protein)
MATLRIVAVGDVMLGRGVDELSAADIAGLLSPGVVAALRGDIVTGNLECVLSRAGSPNSNAHSHFRGDVVRTRSVLQRFDVLSLANNHINDFGPEAIAGTMAELEGLGIRHVGVGKTPNEARLPAVFERPCGGKVAIFGATTVSPLPAGAAFTAAAPDKALFAALKEWKEEGAICVLHLHTGGGDFTHPAPFVTHTMRQLAETGVDVIFAHHPHIVQGRQTIGRTKIFYSLGDFVFDKICSGRDTSLIVQADFPAGPYPTPSVITIPVCRNNTLQLNLIAGAAHTAFNERLKMLDSMIDDGSSVAAFREEFGNPLVRIFRDVLKDVRIGGAPALWAKIRRIDRRRLSLLIGPAWSERVTKERRK